MRLFSKICSDHHPIMHTSCKSFIQTIILIYIYNDSILLQNYCEIKESLIFFKLRCIFWPNLKISTIKGKQT